MNFVQRRTLNYSKLHYTQLYITFFEIKKIFHLLSLDFRQIRFFFILLYHYLR